MRGEAAHIVKARTCTKPQRAEPVLASELSTVANTKGSALVCGPLNITWQLVAVPALFCQVTTAGRTRKPLASAWQSTGTLVRLNDAVVLLPAMSPQALPSTLLKGSGENGVENTEQLELPPLATAMSGRLPSPAMKTPTLYR